MVSMKIKYEFFKKCDSCEKNKHVREIKGLDPKRSNLSNFLCRKCDNSYLTIPKILRYNNKNLKETTNIFGQLI